MTTEAPTARPRRTRQALNPEPNRYAQCYDAPDPYETDLEERMMYTTGRTPRYKAATKPFKEDADRHERVYPPVPDEPFNLELDLYGDFDPYQKPVESKAIAKNDTPVALSAT